MNLFSKQKNLVKKRKLKFVYNSKTAMFHSNNEKDEKKEPDKHLCCASPVIISKEVLDNSKANKY